MTGQEIVLGAPVAPMSAVPFRQRALEGKVALVTGAARGIGRATSLVLAREGAKVLCLDRASENEALASLAHQIRGAVLAVDLLDTDAPEQVHKVIRSFGALDIVVHNAGITRDKTFLRMSQEQWDSVLNVNLGAALRLHQATLPLLRTNSRIVALSSIAGIAGNAGQTAYAASKAALAGWVRGLSQGDLPVGTTANAIAPGFIETRLTAAIPVAIREVARRLSALGQGGLPEDIAEAILFFARPDTDCLHGHTLRVCGGAFVGA